MVAATPIMPSAGVWEQQEMARSLWVWLGVLEGSVASRPQVCAVLTQGRLSVKCTEAELLPPQQTARDGE